MNKGVKTLTAKILGKLRNAIQYVEKRLVPCDMGKDETRVPNDVKGEF